MAGAKRRSSGMGGDDRRLVADLGKALREKRSAPLNPLQRVFADGEYAFIVVADDGLHWFLEYPSSEFSAEVARDALKTLGLGEHARILDELIQLRSFGAAIDDARVAALQARWDALPPVDPEVAKWVRSNAEGLERPCSATGDPSRA